MRPSGKQNLGEASPLLSEGLAAGSRFWACPAAAHPPSDEAQHLQDAAPRASEAAMKVCFYLLGPQFSRCRGAAWESRGSDGWIGGGCWNFLSCLPPPCLAACHLFQVRHLQLSKRPSSGKRLAEGLLLELQIKTSLRATISVLTSPSYISA